MSSTTTDTNVNRKKLSIAETRASFMKGAQEQFKKPEDQQPFVPTTINHCQVEKFSALFEKYYDVDKDGFITENDFKNLNEKICDYTGWNQDDFKARKLVEYHNDLFKCLLAEINKDVLAEDHKKSEISLDDWLKMWDRNMNGALAIFHLPQWVQVMPLNLFTFIDKYGRGHVTKQNLFEFYTDFMLLDDKRGKAVADNAWSQMTGNGDFKLTLDVYTVAFSNFLFAKSHYGPGLFILGTFDECFEMKGFKFHLEEAED